METPEDRGDSEQARHEFDPGRGDSGWEPVAPPWTTGAGGAGATPPPGDDRSGTGPGYAPPPGQHPYGSQGRYGSYGPYAGGYWQQAGYSGSGPAAAPAAPQRHRRSLLAFGAMAAGALALAAAGGFIGYAVAQPSSSAAGSSSSPGSPPGYENPFGGSFGGSFGGGSFGGNTGTSSGSSTGSGPNDASVIASHVDPGLVDIDTTIDYGEAEGAGTGMVLTSSGEVLTNNHVIDGATSISVTDVGNGETYSATVVGYDQSQDVAVLQLKDAHDLTTIKAGNSSSVSTGESVVGIGNAGGAGGTPSYAGGTVTATNKHITASDSLTGTDEHLSDMIETNAHIEAGDSGGPLVTTSGVVIGMDTAGASSNGGFETSSTSTASEGFAIPINEARSIAKRIEDGSASSRVHIGATAFLGVEVEPSSTTTPFGSGSGSSASGAAIIGVVTGSPASGAGLAGGDVVTSVGGHAITSASSLEKVLVTDEKPGRSVKVTYTDSSGVSHTVSLVLASGPPD